MGIHTIRHKPNNHLTRCRDRFRLSHIKEAEVFIAECAVATIEIDFACVLLEPPLDGLLLMSMLVLGRRRFRGSLLRVRFFLLRRDALFIETP